MLVLFVFRYLLQWYMLPMQVKWRLVHLMSALHPIHHAMSATFTRLTKLWDMLDWDFTLASTYGM